MLFVKLKTFHNNNKQNTNRRMTAPAAVKWVNLTAIFVFLTVILPSPANGFTPIGGGFQNGEGRKLFGGYRITPKHCRGTKTLPLTDPRSKGPTICMFNHECAQRNGEVVGACMDGFLFGACCQVPLSNANENTLIQDAQNPFYQTNTHSTEGYDAALYGSSQKYESNEFQEIQTSSIKYQGPTSTESSYMNDLVSQKVQKVNKTSPTNNKIFYVNKGSVMVSSPSSVVAHDDYVMLSSSTTPAPFINSNKVSFTTELPMKISTDLVDNEDSTQMPILAESTHVRKNYSTGAIDLDMGEFTHSDITHPGAESVLIDNDLQFSTGYGGPQSVYVPPPAHAEIIPQRRPAHRPSGSGPNKKPSNDEYVLIQTLEASKKPAQSTGTTSTGISTNMDSIESIILMLNSTSHGPSYEMANSSPSNNQKPLFVQKPMYASTASSGGNTYVSVTTVRPISSVTSGSGSVISNHMASTTHAPVYYEESDTGRPTTVFVQQTTEETSNKYHSVEMSGGTPSFVEIPSPPHKLVSDKVDSGSPVGPSLDSYNVMETQVNFGSNVASHKDPSNPNYGYTSPAQPTSDFNKMPAVGEAYPVMDEETSEYFESSMLSEEEAFSQQTGGAADKNIPSYGQTSELEENESQSVDQSRPVTHKPRPSVQIICQDEVQVHPEQNKPLFDHPRPSTQPGTQSQENNNHGSQIPSHNRPASQVSTSTHNKPSTKAPVKHRPTATPSTQKYEEITQHYEQVTEKKKPKPTPTRQTAHKKPSTQASPQDYEQIVEIRPSSQRPPQEYEQISQTGYISQSTSPQVHIRPTSQILTTSFEVQSPTHRPGSQTTHIVRPTTQLVTQTYEVEDDNSNASPSPRPTQEFHDDPEDDEDQDKPESQHVTQGYDVSQSSEADKDSFQTPESQLIAQFTNHIQNGYLSNSATPQIITHDMYNEGYLPRPTPQSVNIQSGSGNVAQVFNDNNQIVAQAGYFAQPPNFEQIQNSAKPTTAEPNRISTLIVRKPSGKPTKTSKPTKSSKPTKAHTEPIPSTEHSTISSTSKPVTVSTTARPSKRPTKRVTKRPSTQKKPSTNKIQTVQQDPQPPHKNSGVPPTQVNKRPTKKQPPSTSYVTGPTTPRPEVEVTPSYSQPPTPIADKVDAFIGTTPSPLYNSIYLASPTDEIIIQNAPAGSNHHNYNKNKPLFVKIPSATTKPPSPTVIITPKPTAVNLVTVSSFSKRPTTTPIPTFAGSNSYIYSPLITRRPEFASSTQEYISIPQVTSNDFDDPGYSGLNTLTTQVLSKIPTDDRPSFPGYYGPTPSYPAFQVPSDKYADANEPEEETYTSPNDFVNFPPVRNPNLNMSATASSVTNDFEMSTPAFVEDTILKDKMNTLVHKIVESLQDNFEALADMIDDSNNTAAVFSDTTVPVTTLVTRKPATRPPTRRPSARPTSRPTTVARPTRITTRKPPTRVSTQATTRRPTVTTRRPVPVITTRKATTKKPVTRKPTRKVTTTTSTEPPTQQDELDENNEIDSNIGEEEDNNQGGRKFQCGVRPHVKSGRIVGGKGSTFGEFPWQVLVRESTWLGLFTKNKCGGVLISNKYVVTAAHCQPGFLASLVAVMGEFDISGDLEAKRSVTKNVKRVIVHKQYDPATFENDLALLELESTVNYDTHIVPICMPADTADFTGRMATVTGWGRLKYGGGVPSVLQEVQVPVIENSVCQEMFHTAGHNKKILNSFLCAGYANGQKDSCEGDSGGPLVLQRADGRYELAGTVSHGIKCAAPYLPGVYMRTTYYKPWLKSITGVK